MFAAFAIITTLASSGLAGRYQELLIVGKDQEISVIHDLRKNPDECNRIKSALTTLGFSPDKLMCLDFTYPNPNDLDIRHNPPR